MRSSITRFSDRVTDYVRYRPGYPAQMLQIIKEKIQLTADSSVADIGSGTGISSAVFLENGNKVYAIEPNKGMRLAAEARFSDSSNFVSINGSAEETKLRKESIDFVFCAQSFHWFNNDQTKAEFARILKPDGHIVLAWNIRKANDPFQKEYEVLLREIPDYNQVSHTNNATEHSIRKFFLPRALHHDSVPNSQTFDVEGLKGRLLSCSYFPKEGEEYERLINKAVTLFKKYQQNGIIGFEYDTMIYWC